jgi:hypothetical protein
VQRSHSCERDSFTVSQQADVAHRGDANVDTDVDANITYNSDANVRLEIFPRPTPRISARSAPSH